MSYNPRTWSTGDLITADELNAIEQGLAQIASTGSVAGSGVATIKALTQAAYDALAVKDSTTLYVISG